MPHPSFFLRVIVHTLTCIRASQDRVLYSRLAAAQLASSVTGRRILGQALDQDKTLIFLYLGLFLPLPKEEPLALVV